MHANSITLKIYLFHGYWLRTNGKSEQQIPLLNADQDETELHKTIKTLWQFPNTISIAYPETMHR